MAELWETLSIGLVVSLLFIGISYLFWRRYDQPTPLMIERAEEKARLRDEQRTWREIEAKVRAEMADAEERAWLDRQRAEKAARAMAPEPAEMSGAWASLGMAAPQVEAQRPTESTAFEFEPEGANKNAEHRAQVGLGQVTMEADDGDVLDAPELVQVRQDEGVQGLPDAPDWELVEKLAEIASKEDVELPDVPGAPDLDALSPPLRTEANESVEPQHLANDSLPTTVSSDEHVDMPPESPPEQATHEPSLMDEAPVSSTLEASSDAPWGDDDGTDLWSGTAW